MMLLVMKSVQEGNTFLPDALVPAYGVSGFVALFRMAAP
jgi:hypothetical protein